jgi:hypothetical protein
MVCVVLMLPYTIADARGPFPNRVLTIQGVTAPIGDTGLTPFELDAQDCSPTNYLCPTDQEGSFDFFRDPPPVSTGNNDGYGPGLHPVGSTSFNYTGTVYANSFTADGGGTGCQLPVTAITGGTAGGELNSFDPPTTPSNPAQVTNPWPEPVGTQPQKKTDICVLAQALEIVRVTETGPLSGGSAPVLYDQFETILYVGIEINSEATGDKSALIPLFSPITKLRTGGELAIELDINPNGTTAVELVLWSGRDWITVTAETDPLIDAKRDCVVRGDENYVECAFNLTLLGVVPDDTCVTVQIPGVLTRTGNAPTATLQDYVGLPTPFTVENCGELIVTKVLECNPDGQPGQCSPDLPSVQFGYAASQEDGNPVHDATLERGTQTPTTSPDGLNGDNDAEPSLPLNILGSEATDIGLSVAKLEAPTPNPTDSWLKVIDSPDYILNEYATSDGENWPVGVGNNPKQVQCFYTDIFNSILQRFNTTIVSGGNLTANRFPIPPSSLFGTSIEATECTITNESTTTPVTLGWFTASGDGDGLVQFDWGTLTETANAGFHLYVKDAVDDTWQRINDTLIPSLVGDSLTPQDYSFQAEGVYGDTFAIADVNAGGRPRMHGPFMLNQPHGVRSVGGHKIDWPGIRGEHEAKQHAREQRRKDHVKEKAKALKQQHKAGRPESPGRSDQPGGPGPQSRAGGPKTGWLGRAADYLVVGLLSAISGTAQAAPPPAADLGLIQLQVSESGLYRVTYEALAAAGLDLAGVDPDALALTERGEPVPIHVGAPEELALSTASTLDDNATQTTSNGRKLGHTKSNGRKAKQTDVEAQRSTAAVTGFGPGWFIDFVGEGLDTLYTQTNVYTLHLEPALALRVQEDATKPLRRDVPEPYYLETVRVEPQIAYGFSSPNGDPWYARRIFANRKAATATVEFDVDAYVPGGPASINVGLWGQTTWSAPNDHHVVVTLNGTEVADVRFDGIVDQPISEPSDALVEGTNSLQIRLPLDTGVLFDIVMLDNWGATYAREFVAVDGALTFESAGDKFEIRGLPNDQIAAYRSLSDGTLQRLTAVDVARGSGGYSATFAGTADAARYHVAAAGALKTPGLAAPPIAEDITTGDAQYLVIAHPDFIGTGALENLVQTRSAQYAVRVVGTDQIEAQFGFGVFGAEAIHDYVKYAIQNLGTEMVHLIGGDTYDYQDYLGRKAVSFVPSLYVATGAYVNFSPADPKYADVDGDNVPDAAIGRTPARNEAELWELMDKTLAFTNKDYGRSAVFAADRFDFSNQYSFTADAESMVDALPEAWQQGDLTKVYLDNYADPETGAVDPFAAQEARDTLVAAMNEGTALTALIGHSGYTHFTFDDLLDTTDLAQLVNYGRPTVITQWGCWNTYFVQPTENTMAHVALLSGQQGAAAVLGASTLTQASHERALALELYPRMLTPGTTIGQAVLEAKQALAEVSPGFLDVLLGWQYLGDPALSME